MERHNVGLAAVENDAYYMGRQLAELDTSYGIHERRLQTTEHGLGETARDLDFLTDYPSIEKNK